MMAFCIFEMSETIYQSKQHKFPEDLNLCQHWGKNLTSNILYSVYKSQPKAF
jgi:hypothetical protein